MASKERYAELVDNIVGLMGGKDNISYFSHCMTRLRFNVKDKGLVQSQEIKRLKDVMGSQWCGDQYQIIIGQEVSRIYSVTCDRYGFENVFEEDLPEKQKGRDFSPKHILDLFLETVSGIFIPFIPAVVCCGLLQGLLYSAQLTELVDSGSGTFTFLLACANSAFYFLPVLISFSAAKRFKCNPYVAAALGAALVHPTLLGLSGETFRLFGLIPITPADYSSTVIPAILIVYFMSWIERWCRRIVPASIDIIITPFISFIVAAIVGFAFLAPLGGWIGSFVADGILSLYNVFGPFGLGIYALFYPLLLSTGMQQALIPVIAQNIASMGYDFIFPGTAAANASMAACALYIFFKARNREVKALGSSTGITALIGVTEPVLFGLILRYRKALVASMAGGAAGGFVMGLFKVKYLSFGFVPFGSLPLAMTDTFPFYLLGVGIAMVVAVLVLAVLKFDDMEE